MPTILVIIPDADGHHLLDALLSLHGYDVMFAECGRKGLAVVRQIRRLHSHQPVIVLTGDETFESEQRIRAIGVNEVIDKEAVSLHIGGILKRLLKPLVPVRDLRLTHGGWRAIS